MPFADWMVFGRHSVADRYSNNLNICILCLLNVDDGTFSCICEEGWWLRILVFLGKNKTLVI